MYALNKLSRSLPTRHTGAVRTKMDFKTFREKWLGDPGTYPIMALMGLAILLPVSCGVLYLTTSPDVDLFKRRRPFELRRLMESDDDKAEKKKGASDSNAQH